MTWAEFVALVREDLPVESGREGSQTLLNNMIRSAVVDIQSFIYYYRKDQELLMNYDDMAIDGGAGVGQLPAGAMVNEAYIVYELDSAGNVGSSDIDAGEDSCKKVRLKPYAWKSRFDMVCECIDEGYIAINPNGIDFYIYPALEEDDALLLYYDGIKETFLDNESVTFDRQCAEAAALFVQSRMAAIADQDVQKAQYFLTEYRGVRNRMFVDAKDRARVRRLT